MTKYLASLIALILGAVLVVSPPVHARTVTLFHAGTFNIGGSHNLVSDIQMTKAHQGIIGWQEAGGSVERILRTLPHTGLYAPTYLGRPIEDPITWNTNYWERVDSGYIWLHSGHYRAGPARFATWVVLHRIDAKFNLVFINTHFVAHAWCRHHRPFKAWRQAMWNLSASKVHSLVRELQPLGVEVLVGDFNRVRDPLLGPPLVNDLPMRVGTFGDAHYDYIQHVGALRMVSFQDISTSSDHDFETVDYLH